MMEAQHTPGSWLCTETDGPVGHVSSCEEGYGDIATCWLAAAQADARLIAAAPDMLAALHAVIDACTSAPPIEIVKRLDAAATLCAAAIAKATSPVDLIP